MDFDLTEEHKMIRDMCRDFTTEVIAPRAEEIERTGEYPVLAILQGGQGIADCGRHIRGHADNPGQRTRALESYKLNLVQKAQKFLQFPENQWWKKMNIEHRTSR